MSLCPEYDTFADLYDHVTPYRERPDVAFYAALAREAGGPVLEMGCGTGRVLIPCARAGATMIGADASAGMLEVCRTKLVAEPPEVRARVEIVAADMRAFDLDRRVALITMPFRGFQHLLTVDDQRRALASLRRHLLPGGRLVFDVFNPSLPMLGDDRWLLRPLVEPPFTTPDGRRVVRRLRITGRDYIGQVQEIEIEHEISHPDGRVEHTAARTRLRYSFRYEVEHLLVREGFEMEALYADFERRPYGSIYPGDLIFMARAR
jgi:SAM-dependent methyltransferase